MQCVYCRQGNVYGGICEVCETPNLRRREPNSYYSGGGYYADTGDGIGVVFIIVIILSIMQWIFGG